MPDGEVVALDRGRSVPLGVLDGAQFHADEAELPLGATLALFTDGLVERRDTPIDDGLAKLAKALAAPASSLASLANRLMNLVEPSEQADDVAVLLARLTADTDRLVLPVVRNLREVRAVRASLAGWLRSHEADEDDVLAVTVAVAEAVVNSLQHAYPLSGGDVEIEASHDDCVVVVTVTDHGRWRPADPTRGGGRGLVLVRGLVDAEVDTGPAGTVVTLRRRLGSGR
jgi:anti-sigma regulatory factor (Ser/Thr protein kinase)